MPIRIPPVALDATTSVNDAIKACPASITVLNELGVDTCCGGARPLGEVAAELSLTPEVLIAMIEEAGR